MHNDDEQVVAFEEGDIIYAASDYAMYVYPNAPVREPQIGFSLAEAKAMQIMPGGMCLRNWLRLRGLVNEPMIES